MSVLWAELHQRALIFSGKDDNHFLRTWVTKLPRFTTGCRCNEFWNKWILSNPPDFSSPDAYFAWTVKTHNAVNSKLSRPSWTIEQAKTKWTPPP